MYINFHNILKKEFVLIKWHLCYTYNKKEGVTMKKALPIGVMDYHKLISENYYNVDKSLMIKDFLERKTTVTLITRPRRFGKTLNMSMMAEFFDITKNSKDIFKNTKIMQTEYASYINQYPTIFISFANAKGHKEQFILSIKTTLQDIYEKNEHVFSNMSKFEKSRYNRIVDALIHDNSLNTISESLDFLMKRMEKYYHQKVMVFIDEYDTPFIEAHVGEFYDDIKSGLASLLHNALKTSPSLQYAMLTCIQRVAKENIFSDLNNPAVCTLTDQHYSQYFGFTETETKAMLEYYGLSLNDKVKAMYDGYHIGNMEIYNPWSIINYIDNKELRPYWVNTSSNKMIKDAMKECDTSFKQGYEKLIETGKLETLVQMETSFFEVSNTPNLWGLFVNAGYLTTEKTNSLQIDRYILRIPNQEVQKEFQQLTSYYLNISSTDLSGLCDALLFGNQIDFENYYTHILLTLPSYLDLQNENSYHVMFLGMCAWLSHDYEIISNKEAGKGRCDIILKAKSAISPSYILEFKYSTNKEKIEQLSNQAIQQIQKNHYEANMSSKVIYIGLAHCGKDVFITWRNKDKQ